jgi:hypothetical protein
MLLLEISAMAVMMEAVSISETSVNLYESTRRSIPEDSHFHTRLRDNLQCRQFGVSVYTVLWGEGSDHHVLSPLVPLFVSHVLLRHVPTRLIHWMVSTSLPLLCELLAWFLRMRRSKWNRAFGHLFVFAEQVSSIRYPFESRSEKGYFGCLSFLIG